MSESSYIYAFETDPGYVKVGWSKSAPHDRITKAQMYFAKDLVAKVFPVDGGMEVEREVHEVLEVNGFTRFRRELFEGDFTDVCTIVEATISGRLSTRHERAVLKHAVEKATKSLRGNKYPAAVRHLMYGLNVACEIGTRRTYSDQRNSYVISGPDKEKFKARLELVCPAEVIKHRYGGGHYVRRENSGMYDAVVFDV